MNDKLLYLECFSGISGDMAVGALLDLGAQEQVLRDALDSLGVDGYSIRIGRTQKCGIDACNFDVDMADGSHDHHHHDHGHEHDHDHDHHHDHDHDHGHDHGHHHHHDHHEHHHRNLHDILHIIDHGTLTPRAKDIAKTIFSIIAQAESKAHGVPQDQVHFHEVGAIDSIVDIVSVAVCMDNLGIDQVVVSPVWEGQGYVQCQHGRMPVPVPAVANIAQAENMVLHITQTQGEMVTPTGLAIAAALKTQDHLPEQYRVERIGIGAGNKDFPHANILRAMVLEPVTKEPEGLWVLETNVDDVTGEALGYTMEALMDAGVNDLFYTPIVMKKNRPATKVTVLCQGEQIPLVEDLLFSNLTTIGIRRYPVERTVLERKQVQLDTPYGPCTYKVCTHGTTTRAYPEYEEVKRICAQEHLGFETVLSQLKTCGVN